MGALFSGSRASPACLLFIVTLSVPCLLQNFCHFLGVLKVHFPLKWELRGAGTDENIWGVLILHVLF